MSEFVVPTLPVTPDRVTFEREVFLAERELCQQIADREPGIYKVQTHFPVVIDTVPEAEREVFSNTARPLSFDEFAEILPGTAKIIETDLTLLGTAADTSGRTLTGVGVNNRTYEPWTSDEAGWHMDDITVSPTSPYDMFYLIANADPTIFFEGPTTIKTMQVSNDKKRLDCYDAEDETNSSRDFNGLGKIARAPEYGITRMNPFTVHSFPFIRQAFQRTLMRPWVTPTKVPHAAPLDSQA